MTGDDVGLLGVVIRGEKLDVGSRVGEVKSKTSYCVTRRCLDVEEYRVMVESDSINAPLVDETPIRGMSRPRSE